MRARARARDLQCGGGWARSNPWTPFNDQRFRRGVVWCRDAFRCARCSARQPDNVRVAVGSERRLADRVEEFVFTGAGTGWRQTPRRCASGVSRKSHHKHSAMMCASIPVDNRGNPVRSFPYGSRALERVPQPDAVRTRSIFVPSFTSSFSWAEKGVCTVVDGPRGRSVGGDHEVRARAGAAPHHGELLATFCAGFSALSAVATTVVLRRHFLAVRRQAHFRS